MRAPTAKRKRLRKGAVCSIHPTFRGSGCGLRGKFCSRNGCPILLARAKPGRGGQYGTGRPGGAWRPKKCRSLGCTPRGLMGDRGPQPPARFGNFSAVKSSPPEANKPALPERCRRTDLPARTPLSRASRASSPQGEPWGAAVQTVLRSHRTLHERPLRGPDASPARCRRRQRSAGAVSPPTAHRKKRLIFLGNPVPLG